MIKLFLTSAMNFGIGTAICKGSGSTFSKGPLILWVRFIEYVIWWLSPDAYLEPIGTSTMELLFENSLHLWKSCIVNVRPGSKYASEYYNNKFYCWPFHFKNNEFLKFLGTFAGELSCRVQGFVASTMVKILRRLATCRATRIYHVYY